MPKIRCALIITMVLSTAFYVVTAIKNVLVKTSTFETSNTSCTSLSTTLLLSVLALFTRPYKCVLGTSLWSSHLYIVQVLNISNVVWFHLINTNTHNCMRVLTTYCISFNWWVASTCNTWSYIFVNVLAVGIARKMQSQSFFTPTGCNFTLDFPI